MKHSILVFAVCVSLGGVVACSKQPSGDGSKDVALEPTQAQIDATIYPQIVLQVKSLIEVKQYDVATERIKRLEAMELTPEQRRTVDHFKSQIPQK